MYIKGALKEAKGQSREGGKCLQIMGLGMNLVSRQGLIYLYYKFISDHCNKVNIEIRRVTQVFRLPSACNIHCVKSQRRDRC